MSTTDTTKSVDNQNRRYVSLSAGSLVIAVATCLSVYYTRQVESQLLDHILQKDARELTRCIEDQVSVALSSQARTQGVRNCLEKYGK